MLKLFVILAGTCATVIFGAPVKRSINLGNPCFVLAEQRPSSSNKVALINSIKDLIARTAGLKIKAQNIQEYLVSKNEISSGTEQQLKEFNGWIDNEKFAVTDAHKVAAIEQKIEALKSHFQLYAEHVLYIYKARTDGQIAEVSSEAETRAMLLEYETELRSVMCSLKIAILSAGNDVTSNVSDDDIAYIFLVSKSSLESDTFRTYVAVQDGVQLMDFLMAIYKEIELSLHDIEA